MLVPVLAMSTFSPIGLQSSKGIRMCVCVCVCVRVYVCVCFNLFFMLRRLSYEVKSSSFIFSNQKTLLTGVQENV